MQKQSEDDGVAEGTKLLTRAQSANGTVMERKNVD